MESTASRKTLIEHLRYIQKTKGVRGLYSGIIFEYYKVRIVLMPFILAFVCVGDALVQTQHLRLKPKSIWLLLRDARASD